MTTFFAASSLQRYPMTYSGAVATVTSRVVSSSVNASASACQSGVSLYSLNGRVDVGGAFGMRDSFRCSLETLSLRLACHLAAAARWRLPRMPPPPAGGAGPRAWRPFSPYGPSPSSASRNRSWVFSPKVETPAAVAVTEVGRAWRRRRRPTQDSSRSRWMSGKRSCSIGQHSPGSRVDSWWPRST
jgi:hypothetical protein